MNSVTEISIPEKLPISGKRGTEKLQALQKRMNHLQQRITAAGNRDLSYDKQESSAIKWAIKQIILYEGLLKKEPE